MSHQQTNSLTLSEIAGVAAAEKIVQQRLQESQKEISDLLRAMRPFAEKGLYTASYEGRLSELTIVLLKDSCERISVKSKGPATPMMWTISWPILASPFRLFEEPADWTKPISL